MDNLTTDNKFKIIGVGEMLWDIHGEEKSLGGAPTNFACHCASLGADVSLISCVGADQLGKEGITFLQNRGVDASLLEIAEGFKTGVVNVTLNEKGIPSYEIEQNVAWDNISLTANSLAHIKGAHAVCFGSLSQRGSVSRNSIISYLEATKKSCLRMFDVNLRQQFYSKEILMNSLKLASGIKLNDEELPVIANFLNLKGGYKEQLKTLQNEFELELVIYTCGVQGAFMRTANEESFEVPPVPKQIASTVGAGDSFTAAAVTGFLQNKSLKTINKHANAVASYVCSQTSAVPSLPYDLLGM